MPTVDPSSGVSLPDAVASLREQLTEAVAQATGENLAFDVESVEIELEMTVTTAVKGEAKATIWQVVSLGGGAERSSSGVHRVKLSLTPQFVNQPGRRVRVADQG
ncbi:MULTISPECIES: trypco2 family protein [unclassified Streptomyces]|uniref:trypco2 family protein n=1 Tax=unclassified Streptomyces TaxID=2593676 RepID=UPI00382953D7